MAGPLYLVKKKTCRQNPAAGYAILFCVYDAETLHVRIVSRWRPSRFSVAGHFPLKESVYRGRGGSVRFCNNNYKKNVWPGPFSLCPPEGSGWKADEEEGSLSLYTERKEEGNIRKREMMGQQPKRRNRKGRQIAGLLSAQYMCMLTASSFVGRPSVILTRRRRGRWVEGERRRRDIYDAVFIVVKRTVRSVHRSTFFLLILFPLRVMSKATVVIPRGLLLFSIYFLWFLYIYIFDTDVRDGERERERGLHQYGGSAAATCFLCCESRMLSARPSVGPIFHYRCLVGVIFCHKKKGDWSRLYKGKKGKSVCDVRDSINSDETRVAR